MELTKQHRIALLTTLSEAERTAMELSKEIFSENKGEEIETLEVRLWLSRVVIEKINQAIIENDVDF